MFFGLIYSIFEDVKKVDYPFRVRHKFHFEIFNNNFDEPLHSALTLRMIREAIDFSDFEFSISTWRFFFIKLLAVVEL